MVNAALDRIRAKIDKYGELAYDLHDRHGLNELYLLCHYDDRALQHTNSHRWIQLFRLGGQDRWRFGRRPWSIR
jgi:hypothetical protein